VKYWLSYGGGVNSTALAILLLNGKFPQYEPFEVIFADTGCEKENTYRFIKEHFIPYLKKHGKNLIVVRDNESVIERWERFRVTGSRKFRSCTYYSKQVPVGNYIKAHGGGIQLIGIDAGEAHRAKDDPHKRYPLVEAIIDRDECIEIIESAGLPNPGKSGCWCCPFRRVDEIIELARKEPCKLDRLERLEQMAYEKKGIPQYQFQNKPISYWRQRAMNNLVLFHDDYDIAMPCECYDGD